MSVTKEGRQSSALKYDPCKECGRIDRRTVGQGLCRACYQRARLQRPTKRSTVEVCGFRLSVHLLGEPYTDELTGDCVIDAFLPTVRRTVQLPYDKQQETTIDHSTNHALLGASMA